MVLRRKVFVSLPQMAEPNCTAKNDAVRLRNRGIYIIFPRCGHNKPARVRNGMLGVSCVREGTISNFRFTFIQPAARYTAQCCARLDP